jgi:hypothetical protein
MQHGDLVLMNSTNKLAQGVLIIVSNLLTNL